MNMQLALGHDAWMMLRCTIFFPVTPDTMNDTRLKFMEAIARRRMVSACYNGTRMTLAPYLMFERRGDLFVSALNTNKSWRSDEEPRLGHFKLDGLRDPELSEESFEPIVAFAPVPPAPTDSLILAI